MIDELKVKIATCNRMMEWLGLMDFNGHVSARVPNTDTILINSWGKSRSSITPKDIIRVDLQGKVMDRNAQAPKETPLHVAVYRERPDVRAVSHMHSPMVIILSVIHQKIIPVTPHGTMFPQSGVPVYNDSRLIDTMERGTKVARKLGKGRAVILRAHGAVVAERSIEGVFYVSFCLEDNAQKLYWALNVGRPRVLRGEELDEYKKAYNRRLNSEHPEREFTKAWSYYRDKAKITF
jgi:ribulose-5-phosphate 4-epimerase/fuculose-1-phosphate aldolase